MRRTAIGCFGALIFFLMVAPVAGQDIDAILAQLDSTDYGQRQSATVALLTDETVTPELINRLYAAARTPEQRHRLLGVAQHHLLRRYRLEHFDASDPQGSIGVEHEGIGREQWAGLNRPAIRVVSTLAGFPAHGLLLPGDLILMLDGQPFQQKQGMAIAQELTDRITGKGAGRGVTMTVLRGKQTLTINVSIAGRTALAAMYVSVLPGAIQLEPGIQRQWDDWQKQLESVALPRNLMTRPAL